MALLARKPDAAGTARPDPGADARTRERPITLAARCLVGRSSACPLRLADARVSGEHARFSWRAQRWEVSDLGSRNGTFVNGRQMERGGTVALSTGDEIAFGHPSECFTLIDASPPVALARPLGAGTMALARDRMLVLPNPAQPLACVFEDAGGRWVVELDGEAHETQDGEILSVLGQIYMLHLPTQIEPTVDAREAPPGIQDIALRFRVSRNEEQVEVTVEHRAQTRVLPPRAHHYTFLTLARARLRDEGDAGLPEPARGWLAVDDLCTMLATDENKLNVEIYRIRQELAAMELHNPAAVIERRRGSRQVRLGTSRVAIHPLS